MLNVRMNSILREFMAADDVITSEYLANIIQVTSRTIRNSIKELNTLLLKHGAEIKSVRGTGYELKIHNDGMFKHFLTELSGDSLNNGDVPTLPEQRIHFLIRRLLLSDRYLKLEELADELFISKSSIQNDLRDVKKIFEKYGIVVEKRPNYGLKLKGDEVKLRYCISEYIFNREESDLGLLNSGISMLSRDEMQTIRSIILDQVRENKISLSDIALNNLIIHIAIACSRIRNEKYVMLFPNELQEIICQKEYGVATEILKKISESLNVEFPQSEIAYIAIHLLGTRMMANLKITEKDICSFVDQEIYQLTEKVLETIEQKLMLGIKEDKELFVSVCLHLKPAINRFRFGMNLRNPMLEAIKSHYPIAFQAGILAGICIKEETGYNIEENEVAYLALHIGASMERMNNKTQVKRCLIVCASGVGSAQLLYHKLKSRFGYKLQVAGTTEYYKIKEFPFDTIDFIVSTIPITENLPVPVIQVNTILEGNDLSKIEKILDDYPDQKVEYLKKELVFLQQDFETKEEVLNFLTDELLKQGLIDEQFLPAVLEREAVSPTCFGNLVAIPHPIMPQTNETFWSICTLKKPIDWDEKRVQFVCLLSVKKSSKEDLVNMYSLLIKVVDDSNMVYQLLRCKSFREFHSIFLSKKE